MFVEQLKESGKILSEKRIIEQVPQNTAVFKIVVRSFKKWGENLIIISPFVFLTLIIVIGILLWIYFVLPNVSYSWKGIIDIIKVGEGTPTWNIFFREALNLFNSFIILISAVIYLIVFALGSSYFMSGALGMANEIWQEKKVSLKTMHIYGKRFMGRYLGICFLIGLMMAGYFLFFFSPYLTTRNSGWLILPGITFIPGMCLFLLLGLSTFYLIITDSTKEEAIEKSYLALSEGKNYLPFLGLLLIFNLIFLVLFITVRFNISLYIFLFICLLVILPVIALALTRFAQSRAEHLISLNQ